MPGKIYLIQNDRSLQALTQQPYPNEDDFQSLLEQYPDLLAGGRRAEVVLRPVDMLRLERLVAERRGAQQEREARMLADWLAFGRQNHES